MYSPRLIVGMLLYTSISSPACARSEYRVTGAHSGKRAMGQNITVFPAIDTVLAFKNKAAYRRSNSGEIREAIVKLVPKLYQPVED